MLAPVDFRERERETLVDLGRQRREGSEQLGGKAIEHVNLIGLLHTARHLLVIAQSITQ